MHGFGTYKRDDGVVYFGMWEDDYQSGMGLKVVPARFCHGDMKRSFTKRKFREIWKDRVLIYQKEIIEMPNLIAIQERGCLVDIEIKCSSSNDEQEQDHQVVLQKFLEGRRSSIVTLGGSIQAAGMSHKQLPIL